MWGKYTNDMSSCLSADFKTMWFRNSAWFWITLFQSILQPVISKWKFCLPSGLLHDQYSNSESFLSAWMCCSLSAHSVWYTLCVYHTNTKLWHYTATDSLVYLSMYSTRLLSFDNRWRKWLPSRSGRSTSGKKPMDTLDGNPKGLQNRSEGCGQNKFPFRMELYPHPLEVHSVD